MKKPDKPPRKPSMRSRPDLAADSTSKPVDKDYRPQPYQETEPKPDNSKSIPDRSYPGPEPEYIRGLPDLALSDIAMLASNGEVIVASGARVTAYHLEGRAARPSWKFEFCAPVVALAEVDSGVIVAAGDGIHKAAPSGTVQLARVEGRIRSMVGTGSAVFAVVGREGRLDGTLVQVDGSRAMIVSERSLRTAEVRLTADPAGTFVGISDGSTFRTMAARQADPCDRPAESPPAPPPDPCCCHGHDKENPMGRGTGNTTVPPAGAPAAGGPAPGRDPCDPGRSGVPTPDGGRVVGDGSGVTKYPPGAYVPWNPCRSHLFFEVTQLFTTGSYLIAADRDARNIAVLDAGDLRVLDQFQTRQGATLLSHPSQPHMLMYIRGAKAWQSKRFDSFVRDALDRIPVILEPELLEPMTWTGTPLPVLSGTRAHTTGTVKVLLIPFLDPGQTFNDADLPKLAAYLKRVVFDRAEPFYRENSFNLLEHVEFHVHGVFPGSGGPVRLPRPIDSYYNPAYVGAHVDLVKTGLASPAVLVFDGRERMTLDVQPMTGGRPASHLNVKFSAILAAQSHGNFPTQIRFDGTETGTVTVKLPNGVTTTTLNLKFTAKTIDFVKDDEKNDEAGIKTKLGDLENYLEGVFRSAETAAGITSPLFTKPVMKRVKQDSSGFGLLVTTLSHMATTGPKLEVSATNYTGAKDPIGIKSAFVGRMPVNTEAEKKSLQTYLDFVTVLAQEEQGFNVFQRRLADDPVVKVEGDKLITQFFIVEEDGGPGATMGVSNPFEMGVLFDTATGVANTPVRAGRSNTTKDGGEGFDGLISDVFTAVVERLAKPGEHLAKKDEIRKFFEPYQAIIVGLVHPAKTDPADDSFVHPAEMWNAGPSTFRDGMRAEEAPRTATYRPLPKDIMLWSNWSIAFLTVPADLFVFCHEFGHALGFGDLYKREAGYRDDLLYMGTWAMMGNHTGGAHHCAYHKWQAGWITNGRVARVERPPADQTVAPEFLLAPVERWPDNNALVAAAQQAFGNTLPVVQVIELPLGGDADVFAMIEARTHGVLYSQHLDHDPAVLVTNCIVWWDDRRFAFNDKYRAAVHLLHDPGLLTKKNDTFDLGKGAEFPAKGNKVTILDRKAVMGIEVFHVKVERSNPREFIDLFFSSSDPYYKNPDIYIDWTGDNGPGGASSDRTPEKARKFPLGQPTDQGEKIYVPDSGDELHWMVARLRNVGNVEAEQVKLNFSICEPPGAGDRGAFKVVQTKILPKVMPTGQDNPVYIPAEWVVQAGFKGHTCILVEVADYKIPRDDEGIAKATDDVWQANNKAQKNVDQIEPKPKSPYEPVEFDFSVNNSGKWPEVAYLEPEGLPYGMRLTIYPKRRTISAGETAIFRCKLELDDKIIDASCRGDHDFRIIAWRVEGETAVRWGGVQYKVRPRKRTATDLSGYWDHKEVEIKGHVTPDPGGGFVRIRLAYSDQHARWVSADLQPGGTFMYKEKPPATSSSLLAVALFQGNKYWSESRSPERKILPPPVIK